MRAASMAGVVGGWAAWLAAAIGLATDSSAPLRSIGEILALPIEQFDRQRPVLVRGVVTLLEPPVIQDGDDAMYLDPTRLPVQPGQHWKTVLSALPLEVGAEIEVAGFVDPGGYAPRVIMRAAKHLGNCPLPEPVTVDVARLFAGCDVGRRVRATGVVQDVVDELHDWLLVFETAGRRFTIRVSKRVLHERPDALVDAEVEVVGVGSSSRNTRGEFIAPGLHVARAEDLRVLQEPEVGPFELPLTPLHAIARYRSKPLGGHRMRTTGIVSFAAPDMLYLQEGIGGVRVDLAPAATAHTLRPGDRVEVAGFPDMSSGVGAIAWAVVRQSAVGPPLQPRAIQPGDIIRINTNHNQAGEVARPGTYDGCLIRCRGRIEAVNRTTTPPSLVLTDQENVFTARFLESGSTLPARLAVGSEVEIDGIVQVVRETPFDAGINQKAPRIGELALLVRRAEDVRVVRRAPWWTPGRLAAVVALLGGIAAAAVIWVTFLRREVARQTARALAEESARHKAALDYEITLRERNQLAADLHDTALQTVTGIAFQLKVCDAKERQRPAISEAEAGDGVGRHLAVARRMVEHAAEQLRGTVWSLRSLPTEGRAFSDALREVVGRVAAGHAALVRIEFEPAADAIEAYLTGNLLLVIQEAVHNALHHAAPRVVEVRVEVDGHGSIRAIVRDDGVGFEPGLQVGPRQGHFGLAGMRERAERLEGTLEIVSTPGRGTTVTAVVPANAAAIAAAPEGYG